MSRNVKFLSNLKSNFWLKKKRKGVHNRQLLTLVRSVMNLRGKGTPARRRGTAREKFVILTGFVYIRLPAWTSNPAWFKRKVEWIFKSEEEKVRERFSAQRSSNNLEKTTPLWRSPTITRVLFVVFYVYVASLQCLSLDQIQAS